MAGAGYKLFATGDVLTAAQVNTYLMQQTVMVFASSAARTTALSGVLAEGMVSYLQDTNTLEVYDGSAWVGATGDITGLTAGTGISISSATGPVPTVAIDTATTVDKTTAQTLTNKTLTSPVLTTPSISNIEAKGDILVGTADNTLGVITAGANGETIVADSSTSTGLRYQQTQAKNACFNSAFDVWQRGTSFTTTGATNQYSADRWQMYSGTGQKTFSRQTAGSLGTTPAQVAQYCMRMSRDSGSVATEAMYLMQSLETVDSLPYMGKTVTLSFYARKGANYSATASNFNAQLVTGTGTDQNQLNFTGYSVVATNVVTLTTSWQRFSVTVTLATSPTELGWRLWWDPTGTAGAADYVEVTAVQLEVGSVPTTFNRMSGSIQGELAACQRYYQLIASGTSQLIGTGYYFAAAQVECLVNLPVEMRTKPTISIVTGTGYYSANSSGGGADTINSLTIGNETTSRSLFLYNDTQAAGTAGQGCRVQTNNAAAFIAVQAEL